VRGSDGYGKTWLEADNGPKRLDIITDIEDAGKYMRSRFARNGKVPKVAVIGGSYGGYSSLIAMTMFAGTYDAGVSIVGISNLLTFLQNTAPYRRHCGSQSTEIRRRTLRRCGNCRRSPISTG